MAKIIFTQRIGLLLFVAQCRLANVSLAFVSDYRISNKDHTCVVTVCTEMPSYLLVSPVDAVEGDNDPSRDADNNTGDELDFEEVDDDEGDNEDDNESNAEEEDDPYLGSYARNEEWLEEATTTVLDLEQLPLGSLTPEDVSSISGLMSAWVKRCSVEACLTVEQLLKRVVDDMRVNNPDAYVTARMYTIVSCSIIIFFVI